MRPWTVPCSVGGEGDDQQGDERRDDRQHPGVAPACSRPDHERPGSARVTSPGGGSSGVRDGHGAPVGTAVRAGRSRATVRSISVSRR